MLININSYSSYSRVAIRNYILCFHYHHIVIHHMCRLCFYIIYNLQKSPTFWEESCCFTMVYVISHYQHTLLDSCCHRCIYKCIRSRITQRRFYVDSYVYFATKFCSESSHVYFYYAALRQMENSVNQKIFSLFKKNYNPNAIFAYMQHEYCFKV